MASIRKRGTSYQIRVSCGYNFEKKQITKTMTFKPSPNMTEKQIQKELNRQAVLFEEQCKTGQYLNGNIRLSDFLAMWFSDYANTQLKAKTIARYKALIPRINCELGYLKLEKIRPYHLLEFYNKISQSGIRKDVKYKANKNFTKRTSENNFTIKAFAETVGVSDYVIKSCLAGRNISSKSAEKILKIFPGILDKVEDNRTLAPETIQYYHRFLLSVLNTAVRWQIIQSNPCINVKAPRADRKEAVCLDEYGAKKLISVLDNEPLKYKTMIMLFLYSGMRRCELCGLEWSDIDFEKNLIHISRSSLYLPDKGIFDDSTKNKASERTISIPKEMMDLLAQFQADELQKNEMSFLTNKVFTAHDGKPVHPDSITGWFHKFIKKYDLPDICIHSLRHTNATLLITNGVDIKTVSNRLGHSVTSTTTNIYAHAVKSADKAAALKLNNIFSNLKPMDK